MARLKEIVSVGIALVLLSSCGTILGLDDYEIDDTAGGDGDENGGDGDGDEGGDGDGDGTGGAEGTGGNGSGGMPVTCGDAECDDENDCTRDMCIDDEECSFTTLEAGEPCDGGVCNGISGNAACVRCIDDESGVSTDSGCQNARPICDQSGTPTCVECRGHADCDDDNDCTTDTCSAGTCEYEEDSVGSTCPGGVCEGEPGEVACVRCIDDASGDGRDTGCPSGSPRCEDSGGILVCVGCEDDGDCDDSNDCTTEVCNASSQCILETVSEAASCGGGVCNGTPGDEECVACVDDAAGGNQDSGCTLAQPVCDETGENACHSCIDDAAGASRDTGCTAGLPVCDTAADYSCAVCANDKSAGNQDSGCSITDPFCVSGACVECESNTDCGGPTPYCNNSGTCVECLNTGHCGDGVACTDDSCNAGVCSNAPNAGNCPDSGDACNPYTCHPSNGCQQVALTPIDTELVNNGDFEAGDTNWVEITNAEYSLIGSPVTDVSAYSGTEVAWLCGANLEVSEIYQEFSLPSGTFEFTVSGYYRIDFQNNYASSNQSDPSDFFVGALHDQTGAPLGGPSQQFLTLDGTTQSTAWTPFERTYTNVSTFLPGSTIRFDFYCENDNQPGDVAFLFDDVSVSARVCQ